MKLFLVPAELLHCQGKADCEDKWTAYQETLKKKETQKQPDFLELLKKWQELVTGKKAGK